MCMCKQCVPGLLLPQCLKAWVYEATTTTDIGVKHPGPENCHCLLKMLSSLLGRAVVSGGMMTILHNSMQPYHSHSAAASVVGLLSFSLSSYSSALHWQVYVVVTITVLR